jgi:secreted trypsin-like serine protease
MMHSYSNLTLNLFSQTFRKWGVLSLLAVAAMTHIGCVAPAQSDEDATEENTSSAEEEIIHGMNVQWMYGAEAATIDGTGGINPLCTGVLIAPMVVLTAGHCLDGPTSWVVNVGSESRTTTSKAIYDWTAGPYGWNANQHDIGLLFLNEPIWRNDYPTLRSTMAPAGTTVMAVGRMIDGALTYSLWGAEGNVQDGTAFGAPFDYSVAKIIQAGDSGGPVFLKGTYQIVAVNSATNVNFALLARVDLLYGWLTQQIAAHPPPPH